MTALLEPHATPLAGLSVLHRRRLRDNRGYFERLYCVDALREMLGSRHVVQINHTFTIKRGTVRGMHFQRPPFAETKIVTCLRGEVFDVAVDLRAQSPTFLRWHGEVLSGDNARSLLIPEGFAHGFQALTDDCEMLYLHTAPYAQESEAGVHPLDPRIAIEWPEDVRELSARDAAHPPLTDHFTGVSL